MRDGTHCRRALQGFLAVAAIIALFGSVDASAQRFQALYGSLTCVETGLHGVKQLAGGGYVAVGESFQQPAGCGTSDAYVAVTNTVGGQVWSNTYPIGTNSRATDVLELPNGELIVCGYGMMGQQCHPGVSNDIFLLHLNAGGGVLNLSTYGGATTSEEAWKLISATVGDGITTFPGDYVVAGSSTNQNAPGMRGAYLLRVDAALTLIWDQQYGTAMNDDYFYGLDEVPAWLPGSGDIVAAGGSTSPPANATDIFVARVNGNNGNLGPAPQGQSWTDFPPAANASIEEARSVIVLRNGQYAGDIVVAGFTTGAPFPSTNEEVFVLELGPSPCTFVANLYFGDNGPLPDRGYDLVEDANQPPGIAASYVMVTGFANLPGGFGMEDVFLQPVSTGPGMTLVGPCAIYGGVGDDEGWSVANAVNNVAGAETPGYVINGFTQSNDLLMPGDPQQLYLIKTDVGRSSFCHSMLHDVRWSSAPKGTKCGMARGPFIGLQCWPGVVPNSWTGWDNVLCSILPKPVVGGGNENNGVGNSAVITFNEGRMTSYPNPLRGGDPLNLRFELDADASVHVAVSDIIGRQIYQEDVAIGKGTEVVPVSTDNWETGTYLVRVTIGESTATSRVVVVEK